ncbi:hypothetical protein [Methanobrevibacter filiformis]|uniref:Uncharacterized protein n=1 Tax=Methanobrevibacter filiformis TaxID=55758 RepID=A0A162FJJ3_9EURY|nr:hypothetical protein [Methanobrevibacter filiformis]KZX10940.1 hypothetical protein MBFIL_15930 [Methanobrevibacter filiformis]
MRLETVQNRSELDINAQEYVISGYEIEKEDLKSIHLVKNEFNSRVFVALLFFLIIGGFIYWAIKNDQKDELIIKLEN